MQPARLHFRWHSADAPASETNAHPHTTPICGWVVANHVDRNLFVYAGDGEALGYLEVEGSRVRWRSAPGRSAPIVHLDPDVSDPALRRFLRFFLAGSGSYFDRFLQDLEAAQDRIEPEDPGEALLMGRPLALVRASLALELQGPPAIHQGWHQLLTDMTGGPRRTDGFTGVRFPIRLGEQDQLGDGLAVYFVEDEGGGYDGYVIPAYDAPDHPDTSPADRKCDFVYQSVDSPPLMITMLVDPRGVVHATMGVLPTKSIGIPPYHYRDVWKRFEMSFLAAPVLVDRVSDAAELSLPVPIEPEHSWTFVEKREGSFQHPRPIRPGPLQIPFAAPVAIREGWLRLARNLAQPGKTSDD